MTNWHLLICLSICRERAELYRKMADESKDQGTRIDWEFRYADIELKRCEIAHKIVDSDGNLPISRL